MYLQCVSSGSNFVCCLAAVTINGNRDKVGLDPYSGNMLMPKCYGGRMSTAVDESW